jgi:glycosyltransferase involved in cell wall biosynthesis
VIVRLHAARERTPSSSSLFECDAVLPTSSWTAQLAADRGARRIDVIAPLLPMDAFVNAAAEPPDETADSPGLAHAIVAVGPFREGDRLPDAVLVAHLVRTHMDADARLLAVGHAADATSTRAAAALSDHLRLGQPWTGHLGHAEYVRTIAAAGVLLHLGGSTRFGAPMVEAMAAGTPVVARAGGAAEETLGGAGVLLSAQADLTVVAEAVHAVRVDAALRERLRAAGRARAAQLSPLEGAARLSAVLDACGWW